MAKSCANDEKTSLGNGLLEPLVEAEGKGFHPVFLSPILLNLLSRNMNIGCQFFNSKKERMGDTGWRLSKVASEPKYDFYLSPCPIS